MATFPKRITLLATACVVLFAVHAYGQKVILVTGTGVQPAGLKRDSPVGLGTKIEVPRSAIVVVEESWRSNQPDYPCLSWVIVTGATYVVTSQKKEGTCPVSGKGDELSLAQRGVPYTGRAVFYGEPKYDRPNTPSEVAASVGLRDSLDKQRKQLASTHAVQLSAQADWFATG